MTQQEQNRFNVWLEQVKKRQIPANPVLRLRTFARELAEGALYEYWLPDLDLSILSLIDPHDNFKDFISQRWTYTSPPSWNLLEASGFIRQWTHPLAGTRWITVTKEALQLVTQSPPADVFISYGHQESSAFALLILHSLNEIGQYPFLDMAIPGGDDWNERIKAEIEKRDTFIVVLGKDTLCRQAVRDEIEIVWDWGKKKIVTVIPVWHNDFNEKCDPCGLAPDIFKWLIGKQAIRVLEPSGSGYNNAIVELLNRFGVTP